MKTWNMELSGFILFPNTWIITCFIILKLLCTSVIIFLCNLSLTCFVKPFLFCFDTNEIASSTVCLLGKCATAKLL